MSTNYAVAAFQPPQVHGLSFDTQNLLDELIRVWRDKLPRNALRSMYLDGKNRVKDLGISIPPALRDLEVVIGWPEKAVYGLAQRCMWDGVISTANTEDPFELRSVLRDNRFEIELPNAIVSAMTHSTAFVSTTVGDVASGEPEVVTMMHSAQWTSGIWDRRRRSLKALMFVGDVDDLGRPVALTVLTPFEAVSCVKGAQAWYVDDVRGNPLRRVPAEPLPFRPTLERPFGRSRINRKVMSITDRATRAALRLDVHGEYFSAAQLLLFGADEDAFLDESGNPVPFWDWYVGRFKTLSRDENGDLPEIHEISQKDPTPHITTLRELASEFAGETDIPIGSLGIVQDNPESAEAMYAAKEDLVIEAASANKVFGASLDRVYQNIVMLRDGVELNDDLRGLTTKWRNPALPSVVSASDAMVKQISAIPWLAETDVALEQMGYSNEDIIRLQRQKRRAQREQELSALIEQRSVGQFKLGVTSEPVNEAPAVG